MTDSYEKNPDDEYFVNASIAVGRFEFSAPDGEWRTEDLGNGHWNVLLKKSGAYVSLGRVFLSNATPRRIWLKYHGEL